MGIVIPTSLVRTCALAMLVGCSFLPADLVALIPGTGSDLPVFNAPEIYTVRRGDTLALIGQRYRVTVAELMAWNGLTSDLIEVDQVLVVWRSASPPPRSGGRPAAGSPRTAAMPSGPTSAGSPDGIADAEVPPEAIADQERITIRRPSLGIFGVEVGGADMEDLAAGAAGMTRHDDNIANQASLGGRSDALTRGGTIETVGMPPPLVRQPGPEIPDGPVVAPRLSRPAAKRCLSGPTDVSGDAGMATSQGLTISQINGAMGSISKSAVRCFPRGTVGSHKVVAEVVAGCDGRVREVALTQRGAIPDPVVACIEQTLGYAGFPAHARPDGVVFQSPLVFTF